MSRLDIKTASKAQTVVDRLYKDMERRIASSPPGLCPIDMSLTFLQLCHAQSCGKCVPCRIGLGQLSALMGQVLDGTGTMTTVDTIEKTARAIVASADCAIGRDAAQLVLSGFEGFRDDYVNHVKHHRCLASLQNPVPCVSLCPAGVDVPGYVALVREGRYADAVRLIRKDNPMPTACAYICEHPCEARCRRNMVDAPINIRGLKRYAVDHAGDVPNPPCEASTGKRVAIIGGGPSGLSCAYYLRLMGHGVTIFEEKKKLGGMLRYGIPAYRFPREKLDAEIESILSTGIEVHTGVTVGKDISFEQLHKDYDCLYVAIGAHTDKKTGIEGEDSKNVMSAVEMLRAIGDDVMPDFTGKRVVVIGGGNVAMDVTRSSVRLGASSVTCVYRRRIADMSALPDEVQGAIAEGEIESYDASGNKLPKTYTFYGDKIVDIEPMSVVALKIPAEDYENPSAKLGELGSDAHIRLESSKLPKGWGEMHAFRIRGPFGKDSIYVVFTGGFESKDAKISLNIKSPQSSITRGYYPYEISVYPLSPESDIVFDVSVFEGGKQLWKSEELALKK